MSKNFSFKILFFFLLSLNSFFAQNTVVDSLKGVLKLSKEDTNKVNAFNELGWELAMEGKYDTAIFLYENAIALAKNLKYRVGLSNGFNRLGNVYFSKGIYPLALSKHLSALKIREELGDRRGMAGSFNNIGNIYCQQMNLDMALQNYFKALKINKELNNRSWLAINYNNIGNVYLDQEKYEEALVYFETALKINEGIGAKHEVVMNHYNLGNVYIRKAEGSLAGKIVKDELALKALKHYYISKGIADEIGDVQGLSTLYTNIGGSYIIMNKALDAKKWYLKGLALSKEIGVVESIKNNYQDLSMIDSMLGNYKDAFYNYKMYIFYRDSLTNEETTKKIVKVQMQYEFDKKQTADSLIVVEERLVNEVKFKQERTQRYTLYGGLALVLSFSVFIFNRFKITQKQKQIIETQKIVVEEQKHLVEEKHKEITDSINYAERIQRSFLATKDMLDSNLNDYFVLFKPKDVVSGDFYWTTVLNNGNFVLATADSTGHGVPGAIMSLLNITSLEKAVEQGAIQPSTILDHTRKTIIERLKKDGSPEGGKDGMDCSLCMYDFGKLSLYVASAHNPVWIIRQVPLNQNGVPQIENFEIIEIKADKMPVGKHDKQDVPFTLHEIKLQKGDVVYTLTDGYPDQFGGERGKKFLTKNLREILAINSHLPMNDQKDFLEKTLRNWIGNLEQVDDITIIGIRV